MNDILSREEAAAVKASWQEVESSEEAFAERFYDNLFTAEPALRRLFPADLTAQGEKLTQALKLVVKSADDLDKVRPALRQLGARHIDYGVEEADYDTVGAALVETLGAVLPSDRLADVGAAWQKLYQHVAAEMKKG